MLEKIKYYCVINEFENVFIEVCVFEYCIYGMCLGFNKGKFKYININDCKYYYLNYFCFLFNFIFICFFYYF